jgi:hypothetical protein
MPEEAAGPISMRMPDFVIIGAAKAGTTSLFRILSEHPVIFGSKPKEPEFFARDDLYRKGLSHYAALYAGARPGQICGEASTLYTLSPLFPEAAGRLARHAPKAKIIYIIREPVARTYSFYVQLIKNYQNATKNLTVNRTLEECIFPDRYPDRAPREKFFAPFDAHLPDKPETFLSGSDYLNQIRVWRTHFPRNQMLFLTFDEFVTNKSAVLQKLFQFIGADPALLDSDKRETAVNISSEHFAQGRMTALTKAAKRDLGAFAGLGRWLPKPTRQLAKHIVLNLIGPRTDEVAPPPMHAETHAWLTERYYRDIEVLAEETGLDLSPWTNAKSAARSNAR